MTHRLATLLQWIAAVCLLWTSADVLAAKVTSQARSGYQRVNFVFDKPARITTETRGNTIVLHFSSPLEQSGSAIEAALKGYVTNASVSPDGKDVTLALTKPFRTRHFVSGKTVGIDFIGDKDTEMASAEPQQAETAPQPEEEILTTKKPEAAPKPKKEAKKEAKKEPAKPAVTEKPAEPMLTTKKPEPAPEPVKEPAKPVTIAEKPAPVETPRLLEAAPEKKPDPVQAEAPKPATTPEPVAVAEEAPLPAAKKDGPFVVTLRNLNGAHILNFPYSARTAAAVFERGNTVWIVFSRPSDLNVPLLKSVLPKGVKDAVQYKSSSNSILKLTTDGKLHASAENVKNSFQWNVTLAPGATPPANSIGITADTTDGKTRLLAQAFDVAPTVKFYDPEIGDLLLIVPSFENSHGIPQGRRFPELELLPTAQGIAAASAREDVTTSNSRLGVAFENPAGLQISKSLSVMSASTGPVLGLNSGVLLPYKEWFVPTAKFRETLVERQAALRGASKDSRASALYALASLYLGQGMGAEALGYLDLLAANEPEFYKANKLAVLTTAAHALENHPDAAARTLAAPELADVKEAELWREYIGLFASKPNPVQQIQKATEEASANVAAPAPSPAPAPTFSMADDQEEGVASESAAPTPPPGKPIMRFLKYNRPFIRFYPPKIRQMLVADAADAYIANGLEEKALAAFDTLNRDELLGPLRQRAEYALALVAAKTKKDDQTQEILTRLSNQMIDPETRARARVTDALRQLKAEKITAQEAEEALEQARMGWRGDAVEVDTLKTLSRLYLENKQYDEALRTLKTLVDEFPGDSDYLLTSGEMSDLFEKLYLDGVADEMSPLKSLSLFYEFRDLTPIGEKGDLIIQKLADRLAAFDLIDRATQLLENQINFRVSGEARSRVGARLALLYLFNHQPQDALKVLETTNFGNNPPELQRQRQQLLAQALSAVGRHTDALNMIYNDTSAAGQLLKLDILWAASDWPNVVGSAEDILSKRPDLTAPLTTAETEVLLKLALAYSFQGDYNQLRYLKDYYAALVPDSGYKQIFDFITNDTTPLDREDSAMLSDQISRTEGFMNTFKEKIASGKLSEAVK